MKIVHIGDAATGGGAAHAMSRLHDALQRAGVGSRVLVRHSPGLGNAVEAVATRGDADDLFPAVREAIDRQYVELNRTGITNTHFTLHVDGADLSRMPAVTSADVVHLHWTGAFQTPADVRALLDAKPVVWTLHDLEPLTGGCHFSAGCDGYAADCARCPQLARDPFLIPATTLLDKKTLWAGTHPTFIAPSRSMAELARGSAVAQYAGASVVHIPHGIDVEAFRPRSKSDARRALRIPAHGFYVLCGSNHNGETRKGLRAIDRVVAAARARSRIEPSELKLLTVGEPELDLHELDGTSVVQLGRVPLEMMPAVYAAADVFLHPSLEDNFPGMLLESLSCGTPAVAFDVGGVADIVEDGVSGLLIPAADELAMAATTSSLIDDPARLRGMSARARAHAEAHFSDAASARLHAELYARVAANRATPRAHDGRRTSGIDEIFPRWSTACLVQEVTAARERAAQLAHESQARSEHVAALERTAEELALSLADQSRQVQEKEAERTAIHEVAEERKALAESLHANAAASAASAATLRRQLLDQDQLIASLQSALDEQRATLEATIAEQRAEIELIHRAAADRLRLIEDLHRAAEQRADVIDRLLAVAEASAT